MDDGYDVYLEPIDIEGPVGVEIYTGPVDGGCTGELIVIAASCNSNTASFKIGNCFAEDEVIFYKSEFGKLREKKYL